MWTAENRAFVGDFGAGQALSDEQYALLAPLIPPAKPGGRPRTTDMRRLLDGLFYLVRTGCQRRHLPPPPSFPPWRRVCEYMREREGREPSPSAAVIDTQSVTTTEKGAARLGCGEEAQGPQTACRGRHLRPAARRYPSCRRHPGRRWCRRPPAPAEAALPVAQGRVRR